jgi:5-methylcytosine-specific restriction endonuclease McrA
MKNLNNISIDSLIDWYSRIVANKDPGDIKDFLEQITDNIENRFNEYEKKFSSSDLISIVDSEYPQNHVGLVSCYKSEGNTLKLLKKAIKDNQDDDLKGLCQYCGILKPKTYDHYLPISIYPEFSALAINLIPCCKDCNGKKHNYWKENGSRGIINFYIDNIPNFQFLHGSVVFVYGIPHVQYQLRNPNNNIESSFYDIVVKHYSRLQLFELYKEESTDELSEIIRIFKIYLKNPSLESLRTNLMEDALQLQSQFGINYWRAILRITLSESGVFLNYLIEKIAE